MGNVVGFGPEVPAFMLIRKRGPLSAMLNQPVETDDADVGGGSGAEMAA
jgi:hypothetical protein